MCLGIPGRITQIYQKDGLPMGRVDFGGVVREVCLSYVPDAGPGDYIVVHVGFALNSIDEQEALETLELLRQIDEFGQELNAGPL